MRKPIDDIVLNIGRAQKNIDDAYDTFLKKQNLLSTPVTMFAFYSIALTSVQECLYPEKRVNDALVEYVRLIIETSRLRIQENVLTSVFEHQER